MDEMRMTAREKLEYMKRMEERNEQRRKEFAAKKAHNERLLDLYIEGRITKEEMYKHIKK